MNQSLRYHWVYIFIVISANQMNTKEKFNPVSKDQPNYSVDWIKIFIANMVARYSNKNIGYTIK
jgi:hypothetical protein